MITPVLKITCDLCGEFVHKAGINGKPATLPSNWHETKNQAVRGPKNQGRSGPDYCLDGVEILCETCHERIDNTVQQIRTEAAEMDGVVEKGQT